MNNTIENTTEFNPQKFIESGYTIEQKDLTSLRCIDDREEGQGTTENPVPQYAVPGAGLGIALDVMAAVYTFAKEKDVAGPDIETLFKTIETALDNTLTYHTDTIHGDDYACAGCGYCAGTLNDPENNYLPGAVADFIISKGLAECTKSLEEKEITIPKYDGPHVAKAVMIVRGDELGLPSTNASGDHAYIYHKDVRDELLEKVAEAVYPQIKETIAKDFLTQKEWLEIVIDIADKRLGIVLEKLAKDLPQYEVSKENDSLLLKAA